MMRPYRIGPLQDGQPPDPGAHLNWRKLPLAGVCGWSSVPPYGSCATYRLIRQTTVTPCVNHPAHHRALGEDELGGSAQNAGSIV